MKENANPVVHVVFSSSAAVTLRRALAGIGRMERVIGLSEDLSFGPIDPPSASARGAWIECELNYDFEEILQDADRFWEEAMSPHILPVAWVSRYDAADFSAFLEFIWRKADAPFRVVDVTDVKLVDGHGKTIAYPSLGVISQAQMTEARLFDRQATLLPNQIGSYRAIWRRLRQENAPLRIVNDTGLTSAPITHFDETIVEVASEQWQEGARVVGKTMASFMDRRFSPCPSDLVLWARVRALAERGVLEIGGNPDEMRNTTVRRSTTVKM